MEIGRIPAVGDVVPDFALPDSAGTIRRLSELVVAGPAVLLTYRGHTWPFCLRQLAEYRDRYRDFQAAGCDIIAVSPEDRRKSGYVRKSLGLPYTLLGDARHEMLGAWNLLSDAGELYQTTFLIDANRKVRYRALEQTASRVSAAAMLSLARAISASGGARTVSEPKPEPVWPGVGLFVRSLAYRARFRLRTASS